MTDSRKRAVREAIDKSLRAAGSGVDTARWEVWSTDELQELACGLSTAEDEGQWKDVSTSERLQAEIDAVLFDRGIDPSC